MGKTRYSLQRSIWKPSTEYKVLVLDYLLFLSASLNYFCSWSVDIIFEIKDGSTFKIWDGVGVVFCFWPTANCNDRFILQESHDPNGLVVDQLSSLSFEVNNDFLNELQDTYHIDTNPQTGIFEFDLFCLAYQGDDYGGFFGEMSSTRIVVHRQPGTPWC